MANEFQLKLIKEKCESWNKWRTENKNELIDLSGVDFTRARLAGINFFEAKLDDACFNNAILSNANFCSASLKNVQFKDAKLFKAKLKDANLSEACLKGACLKRANLTNANLKRANFDLTDLGEATLTLADFTAASLVKANLREAHLAGTIFNEADLSEANMNNVNFTGADIVKANLFKVKLRESQLENVKLIESNLSEADLTGAKLSKSNLKGAILSKAVLYGVNFNKSNLSGADLKETNLKEVSFIEANLSGADLSKADLESATLTRTNLDQAILKNCRIHGISAWGLKGIPKDQSNLIITSQGEIEITVDNLQIAQFIYLLLNNKNIREVIDNITSKAVVILGRFTGGRKIILDALHTELRRRNYLPIIFDFNGPQTRDITETISTLVHIARFVIADITDAKSIPQELQVIVPNLPSVPVKPLLLATHDEYGMFEHFKRYPWVLNTYYYNDTDEVINSIYDKIIQPLEAKFLEQTNLGYEI